MKRQATSDERRATSDERRATSDERRATSDERRATSDERRGESLNLAMDVENKSEEEHNLSQGTQVHEANQNLDGLGTTNVYEDTGDEIDELEENSGLAMAVGKCDSDVVLLNGKDITAPLKQKQLRLS